ncbi:hypothetical protein ACI65C_000303 [Semiaphis heraclei]
MQAKNELGEHLIINGCFYHLCQSNGLDFLPINRLQEGVDYLKSIIPLGSEELFQYFDETYTFSSDVPSRNLECSPNDRTTLENNHRTKNVCESWNNRFCHLVGGKHPSIWTLITKIKNELSADRAKIALQNIGESITKCSKSKTVQKRLKVKTLMRTVSTNQIEVDRVIFSGLFLPGLFIRQIGEPTTHGKRAKSGTQTQCTFPGLGLSYLVQQIINTKIFTIYYLYCQCSDAHVIVVILVVEPENNLTAGCGIIDVRQRN